MKTVLWRLLRCEEGQDLIEYGLLAAFISITALVTVRSLGPIIVPLYESILAAVTP